MGLNSWSYCCCLKYRDYRCKSVYMAYAVLEIKSGGLHSWPPLLMYFCFGAILPSSWQDQLPAYFIPSLACFLQPVLTTSVSCMLCVWPCTTVPGWCNLWKDRRKERQFSWGMRKAVSQGDRGDSLQAYRRESREAEPTHNIKGGKPGPHRARFQETPWPPSALSVLHCEPSSCLWLLGEFLT